MFSSIMFSNHFICKSLAFLVYVGNFIRLKTCELLNTLIYVSRDEIFVPTKNLGIFFLNTLDPDLLKVSASTEDWSMGILTNCKSEVNNRGNPKEVLRDSNDKETWENTIK